ncbi:MAG: hypothetical protein IID51_03250 [Proteobacteria bacterium]|nr:hypothetical protein [Pseudomonadota bacterium]
MRTYRAIFLLLAVAGIAIAREAPGPEIDIAENLPGSETVENPASLTGDEWAEILAPVLASARAQ